MTRRRARSPRRTSLARFFSIACVGALASAWSSSAAAQAPTPTTTPSTAPAPPPGGGTSPKRQSFDYDARPDQTTAGDVLIWVPRIVFFPVYLVTEFVVRRPLGLLVTSAEKGRWVEAVTDLFTFGPTNNIGIVPTALLDFGFRPSVGVYFFWDDLGAKGNAFRIHAATGGPDWWRLTVADRIPIDPQSYVKMRGELSIRPDWLFWGIGPESRDDDRGKYEARTLDASVTLHTGFREGNALEAYAGVRNARFSDEPCGSATPAAAGAGGGVELVCRTPSVPLLAAQGRYPLPPGFDAGYTALRQGLRLGLDSRKPRPAPGSGVRLDVAGEHDIDLERPGPNRWVRYGATLDGFLDLTGHNRVLGLSIATEFADPLGDDEVPFTELTTLGGFGNHRGFLPGRLLGRSAVSATLEYTYPIWAFLDGTAQVGVGNVFGEHLRDFDAELLRLSWVFGIRTVGERDHSFNILVGGGTDPFVDGAGLNELRFVLGATQGF